MATVRWSDDAYDSFNSIYELIARDSPPAAEVFAGEVIEAARSLSLFPQAGRVVPEFGRDDLRELILRNYRLIYFVRDDVVRIALVYHGARLLRRDLNAPN